MSKYDNLLAVETTENTEPATSSNVHDDQTREEIQLKNARAKFPEAVEAGDAYNIVCGTEWLLNRLAKTVEGKGAKQQVGRLAMRTRRAKRQIQDDFRALNQGDLRAYKLAHPTPTTIDAREITDDEIRALGVTDQYSDRLFVGADFKLPKLLKAEILGQPTAEPAPEPEPEPEPVETCNGVYLSGKKAGEPCTAEAKDHGFCLRHQQQAEIETDATMFEETEPESEPEPTPEPKTTDTTTGTADAEMAKAEAISAAAEAIKAAAEALKNLE